MTFGSLMLAGGAEFGGEMVAADRAAISLVTGTGCHVAILTTAAAYDDNHLRAGSRGVEWFKGLPVAQVSTVDVVNRSDAEDPLYAQKIREADLFYILGGYPAYLARTIAGSACLDSIRQKYFEGGIIAGSSAGAMVLCEFFFNPEDKQVYKGFGMLPGTLVIPHYRRFSADWLGNIQEQKGKLTIIGIDEETAMLQQPSGFTWHVHGKGGVFIHHKDGTSFQYRSGDSFVYEFQVQ